MVVELIHFITRGTAVLPFIPKGGPKGGPYKGVHHDVHHDVPPFATLEATDAVLLADGGDAFSGSARRIALGSPRISSLR